MREFPETVHTPSNVSVFCLVHSGNPGVSEVSYRVVSGKRVVADGGQLFLYRLKDEAVRRQFQINQERERPVRVLRKVSRGVVDLGLFVVSGFLAAGPGDQVLKFGAEFVRFVWVAA